MARQPLHPYSGSVLWVRAREATSLIIALLFFTAVAWAQSTAAPSNCPTEPDDDRLETAIDDCTQLIQSGLLSAHDRAMHYKNRGLAFYKKKDYDRAIQDYDRAIGLAPKDGTLLARRANAYQEKRQYERALADYESAAQLDPTFDVDRPRGFLFFYLGRMTQSAEVFERYTKSHPNDVWAILFRYLAEAKIGNALFAARGLETDAAKFTGRAWPTPILEFHLGKIDEKAMFAAAHDPDPKLKHEKTCVANFHAGTSRLFRAYLSGAIPLLKAAAKDCPPQLYESHAAETELQRLGRK
jgi:lipoprotein NlpI